MGKPTSKSKSGLYAMKGPKDAIPQMARNFDPDMAARNAGILGVMAAAERPLPRLALRRRVRGRQRRRATCGAA